MGERIDLILQAGDLGAFPDHDRLDRATRKWGERDPSELAFRADFMARDAQVEALLSETTCPLIFVRGNHEDHAWLDALEQRAPPADAAFAVDVYARIFCLKTGYLHIFTTPDARLHTLGIGRIGSPQPQQRPIYLQPYESERLRGLGDLRVDVLLSHDAPPGLMASEPDATVGAGRTHRIDTGGLPEVGAALDRYHPAYHFFGHYGGPYQGWTRYGLHGQTQSHKLADLNWDMADSGHRLSAGSMGILRWQGPDDHRFTLMQEPWLREYTAHHWRFI